jgi:mono/diheme cytochrome c family protein
MIARKSRLGRAAVVFTGLVGTACASSAGGSSGEAGTSPATASTAGHYTAEQGSRGAEVFDQRCGGCHTEREFAGRLFETSWGGKSLFEFFDYIRSAMPHDDPGALSDQEYADIVAFVLQNNGHPTGGNELPPRPDALSALRFD